MKVFLLSDLVVHELVSMQLEGAWLTPAQFSESARLWMSRHVPQVKLSEELMRELEREALEIAQRLIKEEGDTDAADSTLKRFFLDIPVVNYAEPMSGRALAASLEACRERLCCCDSGFGSMDSATQADSEFACHPALRRFLCAPRREQCDGAHADTEKR